MRVFSLKSEALPGQPAKSARSAALTVLMAALSVGLGTGSALMPASAHAADLTVSAASSLTDAFKALALAYEKQHPQTHVVLNFAASDVLLAQIVQGAPADVFASADETAMDKAVKADAVDTRTRADFALNSVVLIVPSDNPRHIGKPEDLKNSEVTRVTYGNPASVPVGRYTHDALTRLDLWSSVESKGVVAENVRQALSYVTRGEVDAGFVFATDAASTHGKVTQIAAVTTSTPVSYPIAVTRTTRQSGEAAQFIQFVRSAQGSAIMKTFGFGQP